MKQRRLPRSVRKFIRRKKAEIRRAHGGNPEAERQIRDFIRVIFERYNRHSVQS